MNAPAILEARAAWIAEDAQQASSLMRQLPEEHFVQIVEWLLVPISPAKVAEIAEKELGLPPAKVPGKTALYEFWDSFSRYWLQAWRRQAARGAQAIREEVEKAPGDWQTPVLDMLQQRAWEMLSDRGCDAKDLKGLVTMVLKHKDQELKAQQLALQTRRMELLEKQSEEAAKTLGDSKLSDRQIAERMREIFKK